MRAQARQGAKHKQLNVICRRRRKHHPGRFATASPTVRF